MLKFTIAIIALDYELNFNTNGLGNAIGGGTSQRDLLGFTGFGASAHHLQWWVEQR